MNNTIIEEDCRILLRNLMGKVPALLRDVGGPEKFDEYWKRLERAHVFWRGLRINLDIYPSSLDDPVVIFHGGLGTYSRFYIYLLATLSEQGFNVVGLDRPGHGFSEGRCGDCTVEDLIDLMPSVMDLCRRRFNDRIGMAGSSLGGITTFYLLPNLPGIRSAVCHNLLYPGQSLDRAHAALRPLIRHLSRFFPQLSIPLDLTIPLWLKNLLQETPEIVDYFKHHKEDRLFASTPTLRSFASYFDGYRPTRPYSEMETPTLALVGEKDGVLSPEFCRRSWDMARLPRGEFRVFKGARHLIFFDHLKESVALLADWFHESM